MVKRFGFVCSVLTAITAVGTAWGDVILQNGGFESHEDGIVSGWNNLRAPLRLDTSAGRGGGAALVFDAASKPEHVVLNQEFPAEPGKSFRATLWAKTENLVGGRAMVCLEWYDANGRWAGGVYSQGIRGTRDWTEINVTASRLPEKARKFRVGVYVERGGYGRAWFDDVTLKRLETPAVAGLYSNAYRNRAADGSVTFFADLNLSAAELSHEEAAAFFSLPFVGGRRTVPAKGISGNWASVTVDAGSLESGDVGFVLKNMQGKEVGRSSLRFEKLKREADTGVRIDRHNRLIVNGKPFFPIGMYWGKVTAEDLDTYAKGPFNCLMPYVKISRQELDLCAAHGLKAFCNLKDYYTFVNRRGAGFCSAAQNEAEVRRIVAELKDHPALLGWYLNDEIPPAYIPELTARYRLLTETDPDHPTWTMLYQVKQTREYLPSFDIGGSDPYPHSDWKRWSDSYTWTKEQRSGTFGARPLWQAIQSHDSAAYMKGPREKLMETHVTSVKEVRSLTWQALTAGANGFFFYSFFDLKKMDWKTPFAESFGGVCEVAAELKRYEQVFLSTEPVDAKADTPHLGVRAWRHDGSVYLAVANLRVARSAGRVRMSGVGGSVETLLGTEPSQDLRFELEPFGVSFVRLMPRAERAGTVCTKPGKPSCIMKKTLAEIPLLEGERWWGGKAAAGVDFGGEWKVSGKGFEGVARLPGTLADAGLGVKQDYSTWLGITNRIEKGALRLSHVYRGKATWSRTVEVPKEYSGKTLELYLERVMWSSELKVDGRVVGRRDSLGTPHVYRFAPGELTPGLHRFDIVIDNSSHYGFLGVSHGWGWSTQTCWNGIIGRFELREVNPLDSVQVFAPYPTREVSVEFGGDELTAEIDGISLKGADAGGRFRFELPFDPVPWSEGNPRLYTLTLSSGRYRRDVRIGFRTIERRGKRLYLNGVPLWMRGNVDNCQFPLTGYPAMTPAEWRRQIRIQKENGVNAMRFHTWTPPDAAFQAADEIGFYLFAETGYWVSETSIGRGNPELDDFCRRELFSIASSYGNHASFVGLSVGNELGRSDFEMMNGWMKELKGRDPRRVTMVSTARKIAETDDYMVTHLYPGVGPVRCRFKPDTDWDYEDVYSKTKIPTVAHEIGQWPVYPLWQEIAKYDGLLKPFDWEAMRKTAQSNATLRFNRQYHRASLKSNRFMYKDEVEGYLRTPSCAGIQLLDVRDYTGQGEALVGWLDAFFDAKAGISELAPFSSVLRPVAFLARIRKFVLTSDETLTAELYVRNISETAVPAGMLYPYSFSGKTGYVKLEESVEPGEFSKPFRVTFSLDPSMVSRRQELRFGENRWSVFVMDPQPKSEVPAGVTLTADPDVAAAALERGGRVVYVGRSTGSVRGRFVPVYWSTVYFPVLDPCPMLGTWFDEDHPAFSDFPTEDWMDRQWRSLTDASIVHEVKGLGDAFRPIAMPVPDIHVSRLYATLFEVRVGKGRLLVCGYPVDTADSPEARQLRRSVIGYAASSGFEPEMETSAEWFGAFACRKRPVDIDEGDWRVERLKDGRVRLTVVNPPRMAGEYSVLFKEDAVVSATCEGRSCKTFSAIPVAMSRAAVTEEDLEDGRIEFVFSVADAAVPPVASVSFSIRKP